MTYEPKQASGDWGARMQRQIDAGNVRWRDGFDPVAAGVSSTTADTSGKPVNMPTLDELRRKFPGAFAPRVPTKGEQGPLLREAEKLAEAVRQARRGNVGEASADTGVPHKLLPHVTYG